MAEEKTTSSCLRLLAWLSPAFPVGAFSYSHGLERAVHDGLVHDRESLHDWLETLITTGSAWNDAVLAAESHRLARKGEALGDIVELAEALAGSHERHRETMLQGAAFLQAARQWPHPVLAALPDRCPYCVAFGAAAGAHGVALQDAICAWLQAFTANLGQAAIRLSLIGQNDAVGLLAAMEPVIVNVAARAARSGLDDLGSATMMAEITAMRHETQAVRLFRT